MSLTTSSSLPVEPSGVSRFAGVRQSARTAIPRSSSWCVHSRPVKPVDPKTATAIEGAARRAWPPRTERSAGARRPEASVARAAKNLIFGSSVATSARESGRRNLRVSGARNHKWPLDAASEQSGGVKQIQQAPRRREVQEETTTPRRRDGSGRGACAALIFLKRVLDLTSWRAGENREPRSLDAPANRPRPRSESGAVVGETAGSRVRRAGSVLSRASRLGVVSCLL